MVHACMQTKHVSETIIIKLLYVYMYILRDVNCMEVVKIHTAISNQLHADSPGNKDEDQQP